MKRFGTGGEAKSQLQFLDFMLTAPFPLAQANDFSFA
jgi:hypothetical protein